MTDHAPLHDDLSRQGRPRPKGARRGRSPWAFAALAAVIALSPVRTGHAQTCACPSAAAGAVSAAPTRGSAAPVTSGSRAAPAPSASTSPPEIPVTPTSPPVQEQRMLLAAIAGLGGLLLLGAIAAAYYFLVAEPRRKRRPLLAALALLGGEPTDDQLQEAEKLLSEALTKGMRPADIAQAQFALAFVRARLGKYSQALSVLSDLERTTPELDPETRYLLLWLHHKESHDEDVTRIYEQGSAAMCDMLDARLLAGIGHLRLARQHWARREIKAAVAQYERLRKLDVLTDQIPERIDDESITIGVMSLFDGNFAEAARHFQAAVDEAEKKGTPTTLGEVGLLLCEWREPGGKDIDGRLGQLVDRVHGEVSPAPSGPDTGGERVLTDDQLLARDVALWHAVSLVRRWPSALPKGQGLPPDERKCMDERLKRVERYDASMPDPKLIAGLLDYFLSTGDPAKAEAGVAALNEALARGATLPEARGIVEREKREQKQGIERYLVLVKQFLKSPEVPLKYRAELRARLDQFKQFRDTHGDVELSAECTSPSLQEVRDQSVAVRQRVQRIVLPRVARAGDSRAAQELKQLLESLGTTIESLSKQQEELFRVEGGLMVRTGEFLFEEEERVAPPGGGAD